ncbi:leucine-rich repeat-containing protein 37A2-like [Phaenicophaeus curvirostris]|uniref:leucine-rich repeat-containing protein 37A2-like n=1 Tax=Phaenicophaeus curvirostris TaxID=33595 RepID=UPI0037F0C5D9
MAPSQPGCPVLLLLLLVATLQPGQSRVLCPQPCRCHQQLLDCSHAALDTVALAAHHRALSILDFTGNAISSIEKQVWREHPWTEYLILQDNDLQAVKRHSLEGLLLLKHLDLSYNKILSVEEHAFESLPFVQLINLGRNLITQIRNSTFQAWHGMQFLQKLILSHNPLSIIDDTSFFKLPSIKYLDLGATQVTQQALLMLLQTTVSLETLELPSDTACCLCQKKLTTEAPCRTIEFHCKNLCTASAPQYACTDPLAETRGEIMEAVQSRELNARMIVNLKPKNPSPGDHETITLVVALSLTDSGLSNPNYSVSRTHSSSPQHLSRQEGKTNKELMLKLHSIQHISWTSESEIRKLYFLAKALVADLKKKLHKTKSIMTVKNTISPLQAPPTERHKVHEIPAMQGETIQGRVQKPGLNQAASNSRAAAGRSNPTDNVFIFSHHKISTSPSKHSLSHSPAEASHFKIQSYSDAVDQRKKTYGLEDVEDVGVEGAPSPRKDHVWTHRKPKEGNSPHLSKSIFHKMLGNGNPGEEPTPTQSKAEQRLNTKGHFFFNLLVNNIPSAARSTLENTGGDKDPSLGGHLQAVPWMAETHWRQQEEGSSFLNKPGSSNSPDSALVQGDLFETKANHHLYLVIPDKALPMFIAHVRRALRLDCSLSELWPACTKLVSKTELLIKLLSKRQDDQGASALADQCPLEGNIPNGVAQAKKAGRKHGEKWKPEWISGNRLLLVILISVIIPINFVAIYLLKVCSKKTAANSRARSSRKSHRRCFFQNLMPQGWCKDKINIREQGWDLSDVSNARLHWLRDVYQPLDSQHTKSIAEIYDEESSEEEVEIFNKFNLIWMPTVLQKSCDQWKIQLPRDPMPLPCWSGAPQEMEPWSHLPGC